MFVLIPIKASYSLRFVWRRSWFSRIPWL